MRREAVDGRMAEIAIKDLLSSSLGRPTIVRTWTISNWLDWLEKKSDFRKELLNMGVSPSGFALGFVEGKNRRAANIATVSQQMRHSILLGRKFGKSFGKRRTK